MPVWRKYGSDSTSREPRYSCPRSPFAFRSGRCHHESYPEENVKKTLDDLKVKLFADGADKAGMLEMYRKPFVKGFTTNPTLMRKAGVSDYRGFAREILQS